MRWSLQSILATHNGSSVGQDRPQTPVTGLHHSDADHGLSGDVVAGRCAVILTEIMPISVRTTGFALAYSLATAIFGGFTPAISTYLIHFTGNRAVPGLWLSFAAACGFVASLLAKPQNAAMETCENARFV